MIGLVVEQVESTAAGLAALKAHPYDLVVSDMGRGGEKLAGYNLLEAIRAAGSAVPYILYSADGSKSMHQQEAIKRGALGSTDYPHELLDLIISHLGGR